MYGPKYVWFFIGWYEDDWYRNEAKLKKEKVNCSVDQMIEAAEGHFTTEAEMWKNKNAKIQQTISGKVSLGSLNFDNEPFAVLWTQFNYSAPRLSGPRLSGHPA